MDLSVELRNRTASDQSAAYTKEIADPFFHEHLSAIDKSITCAHVEKKGQYVLLGNYFLTINTLAKSSRSMRSIASMLETHGAMQRQVFAYIELDYNR